MFDGSGDLDFSSTLERAKRNQLVGVCGQSKAHSELLSSIIDYSYERREDKKAEEPEDYKKYVYTGRAKAEEGEFPFFTINALSLNGEDWLCSGSLIDEDWAIIPANCLYRGGWDIEDIKIKVGLGKTNLDDDNDDVGEWLKVKGYKVHPDFDFPYNNLAILQIEKPKSVSTVCYPNANTHNTCFPEGIVCTSVGINRGGDMISRPMLSQPAQICKNMYLNENIDPSSFSNYHKCMGSMHQKPQKLCDWRPGGSMLYCRRPNGPWILSGIEDFPESCTSSPELG